MKNIFFAIAIFAISLSSCYNNSNNKTNTHVHDDGTEHVNHDKGSEVASKQELFEVEIDSLKIEKDSLKSEHDTMHSHDSVHQHNH